MQGDERQLDRGGEQGHELAKDRLAGHDRVAEIALQQAAQIGQVLLPDRLVEAEADLQLRVPHGIDAALADQKLDRIARDHVDQPERDDGHPEEGRDQDAETGDHETQHG